MSDDLPEEIGAVIDRIGLPDESDGAAPSDLTGELARLLQWWSTVSNGSVPVITHLAADAIPDDALAAFVAGVQAADRAIDGGATLIVPGSSRADLLPARTIVALLTRREANLVTPQPEGMGDRDWMSQCIAIRDGVTSVAQLRGEPVTLLNQARAFRIAFLVGVLLGAAARRTPCLIDGTEPATAALVADRLAFRAKAWWREAATSTDPAQRAAVDRIDLTAGLPLALSDEGGHGAQATVALLRLVAGS